MKRAISLTIICTIYLLLIAGNSNLFAQERIEDPDQARTIFDEMEDRRKTIETETALMQMVITDPRGRTRTRKLQTWTKYEGSNTNTLLIFSEPGNVRGTGLLNLDEESSRTQRLFLPSIGRIQTIGTSERGDRFMGSDFTYEDLGSQNSDEFEFDWLVEQNEHYTIRAKKIDSDQYAYLEFDIHRERYTADEIRYFDSSDEMIKQLKAENFEQITDRLWSPSKMTMVDLRDDRSTTLEWQNREINQNIDSWRFTERGLRRGI